MRTRAHVHVGVAIGLGVAASACSKAAPGPGDGAAAPSTSASAPAPSASAAATSPAKAPASAWTGTYKSAPGSLYVIDGGEWAGVHVRGDDASTGLGSGPLFLTIDGATGLVRGTASGPLGEAILAGAASMTGGEVTFSVLRKDSTDRGFTGTGVGTRSGARLTGTMRLSLGDAHVLRDATFVLEAAP